VDALIATRDAAGAVAAAERAAGIVAANKMTAHDDGMVRFALARALWARGGDGDRARAESLAREARGLLAAEAYAAELPRLERWLAGRR